MNISEFNQPVSCNVTRIIDEKGLKQKSVAAKAGFTQQEFNAMLNGRRIIKISDIEHIAHALDVSVNELYKKGGD